jgi:hypothetical protein
MRESVGRAALVFAVVGLSLGACSSSAGTSVDAATAPPTGGATGAGGTPAGGGAPGGGGTGGLAMMPKPDAAMMAPTPTDCRSLLVCVDTCGADAACATRCIAAAPAAAQALYKKIHDCSLQACPAPQEISCRCENECYGNGQCSALVEECDQSDPDFFCDPAGTICGI